MSTHTPPHNPEQPETDPDRIVASGSAQHLALCSLVLESVGISHALLSRDGILTVPEKDADMAGRQIRAYFAENADWPQSRPSLPIQAQTGTPPTLLMIGGLVMLFWVTGSWQDNTTWFQIGAIDSRAILQQGQWWRLVTALTLHATQVHLLGNCIIGGFMVHLLCKTAGAGLAWLSIILLGALGNLINIAIRDTVHYSIGFSTAIFAAIGIFSGLQIQAGRRIKIRDLLMPLGAGAGLLAFLGTGGQHTDLGAHFFGFLCGISGGMVIRYFGLLRQAGNKRFQQTLYLLSMIIVGGCWILAWKT